ncbi:hypothetical protein LINPERPRIM_LOCUS25269 [Linum perenne]
MAPLSNLKTMQLEDALSATPKALNWWRLLPTLEATRSYELSCGRRCWDWSTLGRLGLGESISKWTPWLQSPLSGVTRTTTNGKSTLFAESRI